MTETYLGPVEDQRYIKTYMRNIRRANPICIATLPDPITLSDPRINEAVDINLFWKLVAKCLRLCRRRYGVRVLRLKAERYYTAQPPEPDAPGGFHDPHSLGYQYWYHVAFLVTLNRRLISRKLGTIGIVRDYLHDCLHHSTFRSFRIAHRLPAPSHESAKHHVPEVYREQYGINFRDKDGLSYSSPLLTKESPRTINLNLLMDGVVVLGNWGQSRFLGYFRVLILVRCSSTFLGI
jgi:hypothetical protein